MNNSIQDETRAIEDLGGRVWQREIVKEALPRVMREYAVISAREVPGGIVVRVYSYTAPGVGFERAEPTLEDLHLSAQAGYLPHTE